MRSHLDGKLNGIRIIFTMAKRATGSTADQDESRQPQDLPDSTPNDAGSSATDEQPLVQLLRSIQAGEKDDALHPVVKRTLLEDSEQHSSVLEKYDVLIYYDEQTLMRSDADQLYSSFTRLSGDKPLLLVLHSYGGKIEPAYLMSKLCRDNAHDTFDIAVPRVAKSAATLLACGADRIHMGPLSELGPIDPQVGGMPVLALKSALKHLAELAKQTPQASEMFASYLSKSLQLQQLGHYERVAESASQYAERLLGKRQNRSLRSKEQIANDLVYAYKDHAFVIDATEGQKIFGDGTIVENSPEYHLANHLYSKINMVEILLGFSKKSMNYVGTIDQGLSTWDKKKSQ